MHNWESMRVLCLGGAGQSGREICRQLSARGVALIVIHDLDIARSEEAVRDLRAGMDDAPVTGSTPVTEFVASAGDIFSPSFLEKWEFVDADADGPVDRVCREKKGREGGDRGADAGRIEELLDARLGSFTPDVVRGSLIWRMIDCYRPHVVVDTVNTATVLGYAGDLISSGRNVAAAARRIFRAAGGASDQPLTIDDLERRIAGMEREQADTVVSDLVDLMSTSVRMSANLDVACMIRFVQCLHAAFAGGSGTAVPGFTRYVKLHTTGLGGMGFNLRYTHGDTGEPGLSTKLLGKVCATGSYSQLLLTLAHTPGCDVRVVVPATLVGWTPASASVIRGADGSPLPLVDSEELVPCDGSYSLAQALESAEGRVVATGEILEIPYLSSGENKPYAREDIAAISALGQMGSITKEEVAHAVIECIGGDSRYDVLTAIDSALLLPTHTAAVERDRALRHCGKTHESGYRLPSVSVGNLGPTVAKHLYEIEIIRAAFETVDRVVHEADAASMALRACSYILEDREGAILRRQILSLGLPIFLSKGPGRGGLLVGKRLLFPDPSDRAALERPLNPEDERMQAWLARGWIDLTGPRMRWWHDRFAEVLTALETDHAVSRRWFDPSRPFGAGQFLAYFYSISGGERKDYM